MIASRGVKEKNALPVAVRGTQTSVTAKNGNRKLNVPFVGLFLLPVFDWKFLLLMSGDLPLLM